MPLLPSEPGVLYGRGCQLSGFDYANEMKAGEHWAHVVRCMVGRPSQRVTRGPSLRAFLMNVAYSRGQILEPFSAFSALSALAVSLRVSSAHLCWRARNTVSGRRRKGDNHSADRERAQCSPSRNESRRSPALRGASDS